MSSPPAVGCTPTHVGFRLPSHPAPTPTGATNMRQASRHSHARPAWAGATATNWQSRTCE
jgi:hypothetical protein